MSDPPLVSAISEDPLLRNVKLIAEAWDCDGLYQVCVLCVDHIYCVLLCVRGHVSVFVCPFEMCLFKLHRIGGFHSASVVHIHTCQPRALTTHSRAFPPDLL